MMDKADADQWQSMATAPKDGTRVLVAIRASEQGPAEVDVVRWARAARLREEEWVATDSDPSCEVAYAEVELTGWMPLPTPLPKLRSAHAQVERAGPESFEGDGSAI